SVPRALVYLRVEGPELIPVEWGRGVAGGLQSLVGEEFEALSITVERRCHFQVQLSVTDEADEIGLLDGAGKTIVISEFLGTARPPLVAGRSTPLAAGDSAALPVLSRGGHEVRRVPIRLAPGATTMVRP